LVVSPLLALIEDQTQKLASLKIPSCFLSSSMTSLQCERVFERLINEMHEASLISKKTTKKTSANQFSEPIRLYLDPEDNKKAPSSTLPLKLLYVTPERLGKSPKFVELLKTLYSGNYLSSVVIDEAHCISEWGHDFRPQYRKLSIFQKEFPRVPIVCLTASATPYVREDILSNLKIKKVALLLSSFNRSNLTFEVRPKRGSVVSDIFQLLQEQQFLGQSGLVYCLTTKDCESIANALKNAGLNVGYYHANLSNSFRKEIQHQWMIGNLKILCTTVAFGMGIDKTDLRFIVHHTMPSSIEAYYQQCGRAACSLPFSIEFH